MCSRDVGVYLKSTKGKEWRVVLILGSLDHIRSGLKHLKTGSVSIFSSGHSFLTSGWEKSVRNGSTCTMGPQPSLGRVTRIRVSSGAFFCRSDQERKFYIMEGEGGGTVIIILLLIVRDRLD